MACKHEHCSCHEHEHHHDNDNSKLEIILLIISIALAVAAFLLELLHVSEIAVGILAGAAIILSGYDVFLEGVKSVINRKIDETTLMTVAVIAAFVLGEFVEGAMVTILFGIGEMLEDKAVENSRKSIKKLADIQADTANVIIDGTERTVESKNVKINSEIIIKPHERVPLDCVVTEGEGFADASAITGESMPIECKAGSELLSGMINGDNLLKARTTKEYSDSTASRIIKLVEEASESKSNNEKLISRFARVYTPIVMVIAVLIAFIPPIFFGNWTSWIYRGLVCLVASCPCAIVISVPLAYYSGIGKASKAGVLIKGGKYLETLAKVNTMVFDKTGTLTEGKLKITNIIPYKNYDDEDILALAASAEKNSTHPIARAIVEAYNGETLEMSDYSEQSGKGVSAVYKSKIIECRASDSGKSSSLIYDGECIGEFELKDKARAEAKSVIDEIKKHTVMLTGDNKRNAEQIGKELNIDDIHYSLLPQDKLNIINQLKSAGKTVAFAGDGINDAPVIAAADCGFAMGLGSDAAISSSDAVLSSGNLKALPNAFTIAKKTVRTAKTNIVLALSIKAIVIILAALGFAPIWLGVLADTGVCMLCVLWAVRLLK